MSLVQFLPDLISPGQHLAETAIAWLAKAGAAGSENLGLVLLLAMTIAVPAAAWLVVYRTLLVWLKAGRDLDTHRR